MADAKIKFDGKEITLGEKITTIGRAPDNTIAFPSDSNVSRYHAEIERRGDNDFLLVELGSSNGTTVNGERVTSEKPLYDGDKIVFGGTSKIEFSLGEESAAEEKETSASAAANANLNAEDAQTKEEKEIVKDKKAISKLPWILALAGVVGGLAIVFVVGALLFYFFYASPAKCEAKARIVKPENGDTISEPTDIKIETADADCATRAIFLVNGVEFADADEQPFKATIDPKKFPDLANGSLQALQIVLEDEDGNKIVQPTEVALAFETIEIATPTPTPEAEVAENATPVPKQDKSGKVSLIETQEMTKRLLKEFSGNSQYVFNQQFLQEVQKKTAEYTSSEGYFARAQPFKDQINGAFVREQNLDPPLGFILAMSRSQFKLQAQGAEEGLWRMNRDFATANSYNGFCGAETLSDASQNCAAKAASLYLKALILSVFEGDTIYAVAAYGKSPQEASIWKTTLPADRKDFWSVIKDAKQRDEVVRFFAAGLVAENPQKFGLKKDRPISELYIK
ncbi:MAG: FHA domain-containing protein [Acidobacteriota bacterium]|nr:FHA domain-containing protein [Acidobacteriota bacterium]